MEVSLNEPSLGKDKNIRLYPAAHTFEKMKRWEAIHKRNPSIHFPKTAINKQDWYEVSIELRKLEDKMESKS